jgi:hypothetical protein
MTLAGKITTAVGGMEMKRRNPYDAPLCILCFKPKDKGTLLCGKCLNEQAKLQAKANRAFDSMKGWRSVETSHD